MSRRPMWYKLVGTIAVPCTMLEAGRNWQANRRIKSTDIGGLIWVSTIFMMLDDRFGGDGDPLLFETMMFRDHDTSEKPLQMMRCSTWAEAERQHAQAVDLAMAMLVATDMMATFTLLEKQRKPDPAP